VGQPRLRKVEGTDSRRIDLALYPAAYPRRLSADPTLRPASPRALAVHWPAALRPRAPPPVANSARRADRFSPRQAPMPAARPQLGLSPRLELRPTGPPSRPHSGNHNGLRRDGAFNSVRQREGPLQRRGESPGSGPCGENAPRARFRLMRRRGNIGHAALLQAQLAPPMPVTSPAPEHRPQLVSLRIVTATANQRSCGNQ